MAGLTHIDETGAARMVDVGGKAATLREAVATGTVLMKPETLRLISEGTAKKGDVLATARIAGILAAKRTHELIPLCHPIQISSVDVRIILDETLPGVVIDARIKLTGQTGVEMEALTAVSVACLTIYDMLKAADKGMIIKDIRLVEKHGGKSGSWVAEPR
jgi:cyclic pyranopterin phosphate synthase